MPQNEPLKSSAKRRFSTKIALTIGVLILMGAEIEAQKPQESLTIEDLVYLEEAVNNGYYEPLSKAFKRGLSVDHLFSTGKTALMISAERNYEQFLTPLINRKANLDLQEPRYGNSALIYAAANGHVSYVGFLIRANVNVNLKDKFGNTALHKAAYHGHTATVRMLLGSGANIDDQESDGLTALHFAASQGEIETIRELLLFGANLNIKDNQGRTAADWAKAKGFQNVLVLLEEKPIATQTFNENLSNFLGIYNTIYGGGGYVGDTRLHIFRNGTCLTIFQTFSDLSNLESKIITETKLCNWHESGPNSIKIAWQTGEATTAKNFSYVETIRSDVLPTPLQKCVIESSDDKILSEARHLNTYTIPSGKFPSFGNLYCKK